jgi:hypothetical protein
MTFHLPASGLGKTTSAIRPFKTAREYTGTMLRPQHASTRALRVFAQNALHKYSTR